MANICNFLGKIIGKEEEVKEVYNYFSEDYSYMRDQKGKFINPPKKPHFWRVDGVSISDSGFNEKGDFFVEFYGSCAWSLKAALLENGYYKEWTREGIKKEYFKGTCLEKVHKKFPNLKIELFSEEPGMEFSEHILVDEKGILEEVETLRESCYDTLEEAEKYRDEISENLLGEWIYTELPSWFTPVGEDKLEYTFHYGI